MLKKIGIAFLILHSIILSYGIYINLISPQREAYGWWLLMLMIDFPVSLLLLLDLFHIDKNPFWNNQLMPALFFGFFGSLWWYFMPQYVLKIIGWFWNKSKEKFGF